MSAETVESKTNGNRPAEKHSEQLHPAWAAFMRYCARIGHGEIERLKVQDGVPVLAETVTRKIKFS